MNSININTEGYSAPNGADNLQKNWAAAFAKHEVNNHKTAPVLDHPDGCVTAEKLSDEVKARISEAYETAQTASETAITAKNTADLAKDVANTAKTTAEDAINIATEAVVTAKSEAEYASETARTAKDTAEVAKDVAINAKTLADGALNLATEAVVTAKIMTGENSLKLSLLEESIPSKVSQLENDSGYLTEHQDISGKADKPTITESTDTVLSFEFSTNHNTEIRTGELTTISFTFGNGEYSQDYTSGISFDSGKTPTAIDYTDSGILNWVGTDCVTSDGLSIFQPSANTHYDIVFYFNGTQFIGLVNGYVPAGGNEAI